MRRIALLVALFSAHSIADGLDGLEARAEQGDADAQYLVGYAYMRGEDRPVDAEKGVSFYQLAAEQGHPRAQYQLALAYMVGEGVERNEDEAGGLFVQAALAGHERASLDACVFYQLVQNAPSEAAIWCYVARKRNPADDIPTIESLLATIEPLLDEEGREQAVLQSEKILARANSI